MLNTKPRQPRREGYNPSARWGICGWLLARSIFSEGWPEGKHFFYMIVIYPFPALLLSELYRKAHGIRRRRQRLEAGPVRRHLSGLRRASGWPPGSTGQSGSRPALSQPARAAAALSAMFKPRACPDSVSTSGHRSAAAPVRLGDFAADAQIISRKTIRNCYTGDFDLLDPKYDPRRHDLSRIPPAAARFWRKPSTCGSATGKCSSRLSASERFLR